MHREQIKALALANGFKLKQQPDGTEDLNPYVYEFAAALMAPLQAELKRQQDENKRLLFANRYNADMYRQINDERKRLQAEAERLRNRTDALAEETGQWQSYFVHAVAKLCRSAEAGQEYREEAEEHYSNLVCTRQERDKLQAEVERLRAGVQAEKSVKETIIGQRNRAYEVNDTHLKRISLLERERDQLKAILHDVNTSDYRFSVGQLAIHDAEVIERAVGLYTHKFGNDAELNEVGIEIIREKGEYIHPNGLREYARQLRQKAKEVQS